MNERFVEQRVIELDHRRQRLDVDVHHRAGVDGSVAIDRDNCHDGLADEPDSALRDQWAFAAGLEDRLNVREWRQIEILAGEHAENAGQLLRIVDVVRQDPTVGVFAAHEVHPGGFDRNVFDVGAADGQHAWVFDALHAVAENAPHSYRRPSATLVIVAETSCYRAGHEYPSSRQMELGLRTAISFMVRPCARR